MSLSDYFLVIRLALESNGAIASRPMTMFVKTLFIAAVAGLALAPIRLHAQTPKPPISQEWDRLLEAAKREGKVTVSIPASAEMRKQLEETFKKRFGVEIEIFTARGSAAVRRMADEFNAGVRHFGLDVGGSSFN